MTIEEVADSMVSSAHRTAMALCCDGPVAGLSRATFMGDAELIMVFASALLEHVVFGSSFDYVSRNGRNVPTVKLNGLISEIGRAGDREFNGGFDTIWRLSEKELRNPTATFQLMQAANGNYAEMKALALRSCVEWALRKMCYGMITTEVRDNLDRYGRINTVFEAFCAGESCKIDYSNMVISGGIDRFDLQDIPESVQAYDVFISYRRIDGDIFARLINQEFEHRGIKCFFDVERMGRGEYRMQILSSLKSALNFVFVMTEMAFVGIDNPDDAVRIELEAAIKMEKRITIIAPPRVSRDLTYVRLPRNLEYLRTLNSYRLEVGEHFESSVNKIIIQGLGR
jgi:hypothetical protein